MKWTAQVFLLGLGPKDMEHSDLVVNFAGGPTAYILRENHTEDCFGHCWKFSGEW